MIEILRMMREDIAELNRRVRAMQRYATIKAVNGDEVVVTYSNGVDSKPIPLASVSAALAVTPTVGDQVVVFAPYGEADNAIVMPGVSSTDGAKGNKSAVARADLVNAEITRIHDALANAAITGTADSGATYKANIILELEKPPGKQDVDANKVKVD